MSEQSMDIKADGTPTGGRRRTVGLVVVSVLLIAGAVWGVSKWTYSRGHVSTDNAEVNGHIVPILAKVGGYVKAVDVEENQAVQGGQTVVVIDDAELVVKVSEAEADLAAARAAAGYEGHVGQVEAEVSATRARRQAMESRLVSARANAERAEKDLARVQALAEKQIASKQQLDAATAAAAAADANVSALERDVAAARAGETSASAASRAAEARLKRAQATLEKAKLDLSYARVAAPVSGVVSSKHVEVGQLIQAGQPLGAVVVDSAVWVTANVKETDMHRVVVGEVVDFDVDGYPGCEGHGTVESLSPATGSKFALLPPDNATGNFTKVVQHIPVRIAVSEGCGQDQPLRPGMSVVAHIATR